jgi:hypothetical protein
MLWSPSSLLFNGNWMLLPLEKSSRGVKLTIHLSLVLRLRMSGGIPPLSLYSFMECAGVHSKEKCHLKKFIALQANGQWAGLAQLV